MSAAPRILVAGRAGQLARALAARAPAGVEVIALGRPELDLTRDETIAAAIAALKPDAILNAAAYTAVDQAETDAEAAYALNCDGAGRLADAARAAGLPLLAVSTDYVFDGRGGAPYPETAAPNPINVYGASKLAGETATLAAHPDAVVIRTSWLIGSRSRSFVSVMLELARSRDVVPVVEDQRGSLTHADDLADALYRIVAARLQGEGAGGLLHVAGSGSASWRDVADAIFARAAAAGAPAATTDAITTEALGRPAPRPADSRLDSGYAESAYGVIARPWEDRVAACVDALIAAQSSAAPR